MRIAQKNWTMRNPDVRDGSSGKEVDLPSRDYFPERDFVGIADLG